jgi:hypothetical protein
LGLNPLQTFGDLYQALRIAPTTFAKSFVVNLIHLFYGPFYLYAQSGTTLAPYYFTETPYRAILETLSGIYLGIMMPPAVLGAYHLYKRHRKRFGGMLGFVVLMTFCLLILGNVYRWRLSCIPFLLLCASVGLAKIRKYKGFYFLYFMVYAIFIGLNGTNFTILPYVAIAFIIYFGGWFCWYWAKARMA